MRLLHLTAVAMLLVSGPAWAIEFWVLTGAKEDSSWNTNPGGTGIFDVCEDENGDPIPTDPDCFINGAAMEGLSIRVNWGDIEASDDSFDWSLVDRYYDLIDITGGKKFMLRILPVPTPQWVLDLASIDTVCSSQSGLEIPVIFDANFIGNSTILGEFEELMQEVEDRYGSRAALERLHLSGPNTRGTAEFHAANTEDWDDVLEQCDGGNGLEDLTNFECNTRTAWGWTAEQFEAEFSSFSGEFAINASKVYDWQSVTCAATTYDHLTEGVVERIRDFIADTDLAIQSNGFKDGVTWTSDLWSYLEDMTDGTTASLTFGVQWGQPSGGGTSSNCTVFDSATDDAVTHGVDYMEIYGVDADCAENY